MEGKPNVFVASSAEAIRVAEAIIIKLEHETNTKLWDNAFDLSSVTITSLLQRAKDADFGVFVFHPDDQTLIRGEELLSVRDNVLFELGIFIGALGLEKCFIVAPESKRSLFRLPTDLAGVTLSYYNDLNEDSVDSVATSCAKIKAEIRRQMSAQPSQLVDASPTQVLQQQLSTTQSQLWMMGHEVERAKAETSRMAESIKNYFFSIALPATPAEIKKWEAGARDVHLREVKISDREVYFINKDVIIPSLNGAYAISVIVAEGAKVFGHDKWNHNSIFYMDGFRAEGVTVMYTTNSHEA